MPHSKETLDKMAEEIFELYHLVAIARSRQPADPDDLSETEFLTLEALSKAESLTIGEIQKRLGVLPAQMSRIIRALEERGEHGYVECSINRADRRRIDVTLTAAGKSAHQKYRTSRLGSMLESLSALDVADRTHFMRMLHQIRTVFEQRIGLVDD